MTAAGKAHRKIMYLSGTRADFGLMRATLQRLKPVADISIAVTGMHLDAGFGHTIDEIKDSGLRICGEVPVDVTTRTQASMATSVGACLQGLTRLLQQEKPDILLILGDRGEMLAGAIAALHLGIVCAHIHGGERSGTVDEPVRHAISKLASYHFVATQESCDRLVKMGERSDRIYVTGAPGLDGIVQHAAAMSLQEFTKKVGLRESLPFVLSLFHPVVQQADDAYEQTSVLLKALRNTALPVVWLEPNSDAGSLEIIRALDNVGLPESSVRLKHLERQAFCAALQHALVLVGNSSAGIIEAATFGTPVVNVGDRQRMRERNENVQDAMNEEGAIEVAIHNALQHGKWPAGNRYGDGRAGSRIVKSLLEISVNPAVLEKTNTY